MYASKVSNRKIKSYRTQNKWKGLQSAALHVPSSGRVMCVCVFIVSFVLPTHSTLNFMVFLFCICFLPNYLCKMKQSIKKELKFNTYTKTKKSSLNCIRPLNDYVCLGNVYSCVCERTIKQNQFQMCNCICV